MYCKNCGKEKKTSGYCLECGCDGHSGDKFCLHCGEQINPGASLCLKCGRLQTTSVAEGEASCGSCQKLIPLDSKFCPFCGENTAKTPLKCPHCQTGVKANADVCLNCGQQLVTTSHSKRCGCSHTEDEILATVRFTGKIVAICSIALMALLLIFKAFVYFVAYISAEAMINNSWDIDVLKNREGWIKLVGDINDNIALKLLFILAGLGLVAATILYTFSRKGKSETFSKIRYYVISTFAGLVGVFFILNNILIEYYLLQLFARFVQIFTLILLADIIYRNIKQKLNVKQIVYSAIIAFFVLYGFVNLYLGSIAQAITTFSVYGSSPIYSFVDISIYGFNFDFAVFYNYNWFRFLEGNLSNYLRGTVVMNSFHFITFLITLLVPLTLVKISLFTLKDE